VPAQRQIGHVVVLMFENRSFDQLLGHLDHTGLEPVSDAVRNVETVSDAHGRSCAAHFLPSDADVSVDPGHGFDDVCRQLTEQGTPLAADHITMGGFAQNYARRLVDRGQDASRACEIMGCHSADQVPALSTLAREFAVCSRWFSSVPSETWPNRLFVHAAQSDGLLTNVVKHYTHPTTFSTLSEHKISWAIYAGDIPQAAAYFDLIDAFKDRFNPLPEFFEDVRDGTLPAYSFLEPHHFLRVDSQHPTHSVILGDQLLRSVYTALSEKTEVWESVLLVVTWDEHGGFHDREPPPGTVAPFPGMRGDRGFGFDLLGVRVPAVVVSPYIPGGTVDTQVHDHASIVRTVFDALGVSETLTERDAQASSVLGLLTLDLPRPKVDLPEPSPQLQMALVAEGAPEPVELDDLQQSLLELTRQLDDHRSEALARATPELVQAPQAALTPGDVDLVVSHFQHEHMGNRAARLRGES
jgi:phospholipase C